MMEQHCSLGSALPDWIGVNEEIHPAREITAPYVSGSRRGIRFTNFGILSANVSQACLLKVRPVAKRAPE